MTCHKVNFYIYHVLQGTKKMLKVPREALEQVLPLQALILSPAAASQLPDLVELVVPDGADRHILELS